MHEQHNLPKTQKKTVSDLSDPLYRPLLKDWNEKYRTNCHLGYTVSVTVYRPGVVGGHV